MHRRVFDLYQDFLKRHRPVLEKNLGLHARHHKTWRESADGEGAGRLLTLFPGFWADGQMSRFNRLVKDALGAGEQKVRNILNKLFMEQHGAWGVTRAAVDQQMSHSAEMTDKVYLAGLRNSLNGMQEHAYEWA